MYDIPDNKHVEHLTGSTGTVLFGAIEEAANEPPLSSVVLTNGLTGTAFQRQHDGLWHRCGGREAKGQPWQRMLQMRHLVVVYRAPERESADA